jgi:hypothetical protein
MAQNRVKKITFFKVFGNSKSQKTGLAKEIFFKLTSWGSRVYEYMGQPIFVP